MNLYWFIVVAERKVELKRVGLILFIVLSGVPWIVSFVNDPVLSEGLF